MAKFKHYPKYPLYRETPKNQSGCAQNWHKYLPILKRKNFYKEDIPISGDAPKNFIRVYEHGECRRNRPTQWTAYIAKVGHKWYPVESITEYLMNRVGEVIGIDVAKSKLTLANEQIRFLSRYFLKPGEEQLVHGAQIYAGYLEDEQFVELANERRQHEVSRELFTFQFTEEAIKALFPNDQAEILEKFVVMLLYDALVGNNDRHFYNWGVIIHLFDQNKLRFAPVYDTARGLFWNFSEARIRSFNDEDKLENYIEGALPRTGWEDAQQINHFQLIERIFHEDGRYCAICENVLNDKTYPAIERLIDADFQHLLSSKRLQLIKKCLKLRTAKLLNKICS